jgi:hypothetical protein
MASYLNLDHSDSLKAKIDKRAPDLFRARKAKPQLRLNSRCKKKTENGHETVCIERDRDVSNMFELKGVRHVREPLLIHSTVELVFIIVNCQEFFNLSSCVNRICFDILLALLLVEYLKFLLEPSVV